MSFTLYNYVLSGNCYKIRLFASLLDIQYETINVDFYPGNEHQSPEMLMLNPAGTLPVLQHDDLTLTESSAMLSWMAMNFDRENHWYPANDVESAARVVQWLAFSSRLSSTVGEARLHMMIKHETNLDAALKGATLALRELESHLSEQIIRGHQWLVGDHATIADVACFPYVALSLDAGIEHDEYPAIRHWLYAVNSLKGFITMPGIFELLEESKTSAAADTTDS